MNIFLLKTFLNEGLWCSHQDFPSFAYDMLTVLVYFVKIISLFQFQGDLVRQLKTDGAPEIDVKREVQELKNRKKVSGLIFA